LHKALVTDLEVNFSKNLADSAFAVMDRVGEYWRLRK
jgi:hypothetical protein